MINRIIIAHDYLEGSASTNRIICFAKGYRDNGKEVHLMLYAPGDHNLTIEGVDIRFYGEPNISFKPLRRLMGIMRYVKAIKKLYQAGNSVIHIYRTPWWGFMFNRRKYNFFYERGEVPFYSTTKSLAYKIQEYIGRSEAKNATGMLAQTNSLKDYYSKYGVTHIEVINMFVDTTRFENLKIDKSTKYIAYCGTISMHKDGVDDLITAFEKVHRSHPEYKLYLIGAFEALYGEEQAVRNLVTKLGLDDAVVFTGRVKPSEIPVLLASATILALARPVNEQTKYGFPTKLGEYLCTGNPIVLTAVGEIGDYMHDRENCVLAQPGNPVDFAEKLDWVISHYDEAVAYGKTGKKLIDTEFSILSQTRKAIDFMESVSNTKI